MLISLVTGTFVPENFRMWNFHIWNFRFGTFVLNIKISMELSFPNIDYKAYRAYCTQFLTCFSNYITIVVCLSSVRPSVCS